jgi:hypothetical protein
MSETLRAPLETGLGLDQNQIITSQAWLAYFTRGITPAINTASKSVTVADTAANMANYMAAGFNSGTLYLQTDRGVIYWSNGSVWAYLTGTYPRTQAELASLAATLGSIDTGLLVDVTDYNHLIQWTGTGWRWAPGENGSGYFQDFAVAPSGFGWHSCDGSTVPCLKSDGSTVNVILPNTVGVPAYRKLGAIYSGTIAAAADPLLTMNPYTPTGTVSRPVLTMNSYTPAGTVSAPTLTMNSYTPAGTIGAQILVGTPATLTSIAVTAAGVASAVSQIAGSTSSYTPAGTITSGTFTGTPAVLTGTVSTPTFTGTPAVLTGTISIPTFTGNPAVLTGTISLPADPVANFEAIQYFRQ